MAFGIARQQIGRDCDQAVEKRLVTGGDEPALLVIMLVQNPFCDGTTENSTAECSCHKQCVAGGVVCSLLPTTGKLQSAAAMCSAVRLS